MACRRVFLAANNLAVTKQCVPALSRQYTTPSKEEEIRTVTHTGQVFEPEDYRNVRFTNATRYVNKNFGIELVNEIPPIEVEDNVVACNGGDEHLGHPKVYINLDKPGAHACGYCGLRYILKGGHH